MNTFWTHHPQAVDGLSAVSLSRSLKKTVRVGAGRVYTGSDCEWIDLNQV